MRYALIDPKTVDHETQRAAHMALAAARKELRLPMVQIKWFERAEFVKNCTETFEDDRDINGLYLGKTPDTIYVRAGQFPEKIQEAVLHETFHLWQSLAGHGGNAGSEDRANGYAADTMRRMMADPEESERTYYEHLAGKSWASERNQKEMDRRLGKPKTAPKKSPAAQPELTRGAGGYDKYSGGPARRVAVGYMRKQTWGRVDL